MLGAVFSFNVINVISGQMFIVSYILQNKKSQKRYSFVPQNHGSPKIVYRNAKGFISIIIFHE